MSKSLEQALGHSPAPAASLAHSAGRADVQGLRGVAVLLVVLYHAGVPGLSGGFVGVDVFFVISGFLITGLLAHEALSTGHIAFVRFFARRARRLLPAALFVTIVTTLVALWIFPPMEQREMMSGARAASLYVSNHWLAGRSIDYLAGDGDSNLLLHMWSLAVEEQFYLVWPLVIAIALRLAGPRRWSLLIGVLSAASSLACIAMTWHSQPLAFFLMPFRAWQFGAGALVQLAVMREPRIDRPALSNWAGWLGLALVAVSATWLDTSRLYPGWWALMPTLGTAGVLFGLYGSRTGVGRLLSAPPLRVVGDLSYSWYLWHWPFLVASRVLVPQGGAVVTATALLLSIVASVASYRWIEGPIRFAPPSWLRRNRNAVAAALAASLVVASGCTAAAVWIGARSLDSVQRELAGAPSDIPRVYAAGCHVSFSATEALPCVFGSAGSATKVVLFGDSHAAQWFPALERLANERGWQLISLTKSLCPAAEMSVRSDVLRRTYMECDEWRERVFKRIEVERPALVVISSAPQEASPAQWQAATSRTAGRLAALGIRQLWIRDTPWPGFNGPRCLARAQWQGRPDMSELCAFDRDKVMAATGPLAEAERNAIAGMADVRWLDLTPAICPSERCAIWRDGHSLYSDGNHISASWAARQSERFAQALEGWPVGAAAASAGVR